MAYIFSSEEFYQTCGMHEIYLKFVLVQMHVNFTTKINHKVNIILAEA